MRQTTFATAETRTNGWWHFDADGLVLGRLASRVAMVLMGKHKPTYTPHVDCGDFVVITNAAKIRVTGRKAEQKVYRHHTGWIGALRERPYAEVLAKNPAEVLELAVRRMLPKSKLGRAMLTKLKVYGGPEHPHQAQKPETIKL
jgi:large subunit ribosomal protein L13